MGQKRIEVCLQAFLSLHSITITRVKRLRSLSVLVKSPKDMHGNNSSANVIPPQTRVLIKEHIESFPVNEIMYQLFKDKHPNTKVTYQFYAKFFKDNSSLSFGRPQIEELKLKLRSTHPNGVAKMCAAAGLLVHNRQSKKCYNQMKADAESTNQPHVLGIYFDYMQNIQLPQVPVQETFYLRHLTVSVFGIHNITNDTTKIYIYHEGIAKRGTNEITEIHLYSDNGSGKNKNHSLSRLLLAMIITQQYIKRHDRFLSVHGLTELIIASSNTHKFTDKEITSADILDFMI
ncbi:hypothetical protein PR048_025913, partial [Dryococelus australis]